MISGSSHFEGALDHVLAADFVEIDFIAAVRIEKRLAVQMERFNEDFADEKIPSFFQIAVWTMFALTM